MCFIHTLMSTQGGNIEDNWCISIFLPYPVCWRWGHIDDQGSWQLLHLHGEQQRCVGHLLKLLLYELILCRLLEIFGFCDFVHKSQNLLSSLPSPRPVQRGLAGGTEQWVTAMPEDLVFKVYGKSTVAAIWGLMSASSAFCAVKMSIHSTDGNANNLLCH